MKKLYSLISLISLVALSTLFIHTGEQEKASHSSAESIHLEVKKEVHKALSGLARPSYEVYHFSKAERWSIVSPLFSDLWKNGKEIRQPELDTCPSDDTHTIFGSVYFAAQKSTLLPKEKERNNAIIGCFAQDKQLTKTIEGLLSAVKKSESALLSFWEGEKYPEKNHITRLYSKKGNPYSFKDTSPIWQEFFTNIQHCKCIAQIAIAGAGVFACSSYVGKYAKSPFYGKATLSLSSGLLASYAQVVIFPHEKEFCRLLNYLHEKTNSLAVVIQTLDTVSRSFKTHPALENLEQAYVFKALQTQNFSPKLNTLITLLRTKTFKSEPSFFSRKGRVRAAYALINELKDELVPLLMALGELDAFIAYASSYDKTSTKSDGSSPQ